MDIEIIGTESLGVRGLCIIVKINNRKIIIDPGVSLGYIRNGLKPHPLQVAVGDIIRKRIIKETKSATDIIFSHYHGDHIPLMEANQYQLSINDLGTIKNSCRIWGKKEEGSNAHMKAREEALVFELLHDINFAEGRVDDNLFFSKRVPHGTSSDKGGTVIMTCIEENGFKFMHASDIQFLDSRAIREILKIKPNVLIASGPPIYLNDFMKDKRQLAWDNLLEVSNNIETLILDHHILRCNEGIEWLERLKSLSSNKVCCSADYVEKNRHLLEAWRDKLYIDIPIEDGWHDIYEKEKFDLSDFLIQARKIYDWFEY